YRPRRRREGDRGRALRAERFDRLQVVDADGPDRDRLRNTGVSEDARLRGHVLHALHVAQAEQLERARGAVVALDDQRAELRPWPVIVGVDELERIAVAVLDV